MIPNNTNHDTLQVYFDYLEDNNFLTEELRLLESKTHDCYHYHTFRVGGIFPNVGIDGKHSVGGYGTEIICNITNKVGGGPGFML